MDYSHIISEINNNKGFECFKKPEKTDLNYLMSLNLPDDVLDFYSQYSPIYTIEINNIRLLPISEIVEENANYTPGYILRPLNFCVIATTIEGDVYCIHNTTTTYSVIIASHDEISEEQSVDEIMNGIKQVSDTFINFLNAFVQQELVVSFYDIEDK
jgi:hypothetical protein